MGEMSISPEPALAILLMTFIVPALGFISFFAVLLGAKAMLLLLGHQPAAILTGNTHLGLASSGCTNGWICLHFRGNIPARVYRSGITAFVALAVYFDDGPVGTKPLRSDNDVMP